MMTTATPAWPEWPAVDPYLKAHLAELQAELVKWGVRHFTAEELCAIHGAAKGEPTHAVPPRALWPNMRLTVWAADAIRIKWGAAVKVISGYRPPAYNARDPKKAPKSLHMQFAALDLAPVKAYINDAEFERWRDLCEETVTAVAQASGPGVCTGVGTYPHRWVHIDIGQRTARARWEA